MRGSSWLVFAFALSYTLSANAIEREPTITVHGAPRVELLAFGGRSIDASTGVAARVPPGRFVAIGYDLQRNAIAVSHPFDARVGTSTEIVLEPPQVGADVLVNLNGGPADPAMPLLNGVEPAVRITTAEKLIAIWYGVEHRLATLTVKSDRFFLEPMELRPRARSVTMIQGALRELPDLHVHIDTNEDLPDARIRLMEEGRAEVLREQVVTTNDLRLESLQPSIYVVELLLPDWTTTTRADLTSGTDVDTTIAVEPISIIGRITQGGEPVPASVALRFGKNVPKTETNERGEYALRVWRQGRYQLEVSVTGAEPHLDMLLITGDQQFDIDLPTNQLSVRVINETSGTPIAGARVSVTSQWNDPEKGRRRSIRQVITGADGVAILPPSYPGDVVLQAWADGYLEGQELTIPIATETASRQVDIALHREEESSALSIVLPNGTPAAGAEVIAVREPLTSNAVLWRDRADATGTIHVPRSMNGAILAVRHEHAASTVRPWQSSAGASWSLGLSSESLVLRARDRKGEAVRNALVTAWIDGVRVGNATLAFLAWSELVTDGRGVWIARNLPAAPLRILIGNTNSAFDALATTINYPWTGLQTVIAVE